MHLAPIDYLRHHMETRPESLALSDTMVQVTFAELKTLQNRLAAAIANRADVKSRQVSVAILLDRCTYYIASMFTSWQLGGYCIPLNLSWPADRTQQLLDQCQPDVVICHRDGQYQGENALFIEDLDLEDLASGDSQDTPKITCRDRLPTDVAYVIYTSGSTGLPKGVMITDQSYLAYIEWTRRFFQDYSQNQRLLITAELTFDITMGDIAFALAFGTSIFVAPDNRNIIALARIIIDHKIDTLYSVPSTHSTLFQFAKLKRNLALDSLNLVISGGDAFSANLIRNIKEVVPDAHFYNVYGPTEVTINCFGIRVDDKVDEIERQGRLPIGKPFDNIDAVIFDEQGQAVTTEETPGRLCVAGPQVMLGYFNDPETTARAMVPDTRYPEFNRYMYDTGDLAVLGKDGFHYLLGRTDDLVKIKGYRIHPNEVTVVLEESSSIQAAATVAVDNSRGDKILVSYATTCEPIEVDEIRSHLAERLPDYMLPAEIFLLPEMPLNNSGKINKLALKQKYATKGEMECPTHCPA